MGRQRGGHDAVEYYVNMFGVLLLQIAAKRSCFYSCSATSDTLVHFYTGLLVRYWLRVE